MIPLLTASHFQPTVAVTALATALAIAADRGAGSAWVALAVLSGQLSVGWNNDYLDRERDRIAGRLSKPIVAGQVTARTVGIGAAAALVVSVPLSLASGWPAGVVHLSAVGVAWAYNWRLRATAASFVPYTVAFGLLPAFITLGLPGHPWPPAWATLAAGLMGTGAYFINTLPDLGSDASVGIWGMAHRLGHRGSLFVAALLMGTATIVLVTAASDPQLLASLLVVAALSTVGGIVVAGVTGHLGAAWTLTLIAAGLNVAIVISRGSGLAL